jgi:hypothetical protein
MLLCALGWREFAMHETENMLALSVALAEGAAAASTSHLISHHLIFALTFPSPSHHEQR